MVILILSSSLVIRVITCVHDQRKSNRLCVCVCVVCCVLCVCMCVCVHVCFRITVIWCCLFLCVVDIPGTPTIVFPCQLQKLLLYVKLRMQSILHDQAVTVNNFYVVNW